MNLSDHGATGLPSAGAVLGVDVGYSQKAKSSAVCRLEWDGKWIDWKIERFCALAAEQKRVITKVAGDVKLEAAAFDGPLRAGFDLIGRYRTAERMLTRGLQPKIGKPGQSSSPNGKSLNAAANNCVRVAQACNVQSAKHLLKIDEQAIVEAFPTSFLGLMVDEPAAAKMKAGQKSDLFFAYLVENRELDRLLTYLLPGRTVRRSIAEVTNHDDRAALVCAMTALCVAAGDFTAVGDVNHGWIILPPTAFVQTWAHKILVFNAGDEQPSPWYDSRRSS